MKVQLVEHMEIENVFEWLQAKPPLNELCTHYPVAWEEVQRDLAEIIARGTFIELQAHLKQSALHSGLLSKRLQKSRGDKKILEATLLQLVRTRMTHLAVKQHCVSVATGIEKGTVRFNLLNGLLAQWLFFSDGLERKPVSMAWFRLLWPFVRQKRLLMPLVQPEGIYCFYSQALVDSLVALISSRTCIEIAAGDGTLSRFLAQSGVSVIATDDYSWKHEVNYPEWVVRRDAHEALRMYTPEVVICSWPPANNKFERQVFRTSSVQLYIVISSRHQFASGNWDEYNRQTAFLFKEEKPLSCLVLPPELDAAVYVFRRIRSDRG